MRQNNSFMQKGYVGADPVMRTNAAGDHVAAEFQMYVDDSYTNRETGERVDRSYILPFTFYGEKQRNNVMKLVKKGAYVEVVGIITKQVWDSKTRVDESGNPKQDSRLELKANNFHILRRPDAPKEVEPPADASPAGEADFDDDTSF